MGAPFAGVPLKLLRLLMRQLVFFHRTHTDSQRLLSMSVLVLDSLKNANPDLNLSQQSCASPSSPDFMQWQCQCRQLCCCCLLQLSEGISSTRTGSDSGGPGQDGMLVEVVAGLVLGAEGTGTAVSNWPLLQALSTSAKGGGGALFEATRAVLQQHGAGGGGQSGNGGFLPLLRICHAALGLDAQTGHFNQSSATSTTTTSSMLLPAYDGFARCVLSVPVLSAQVISDRFGCFVIFIFECLPFSCVLCCIIGVGTAAVGTFHLPTSSTTRRHN